MKTRRTFAAVKTAVLNTSGVVQTAVIQAFVYLSTKELDDRKAHDAVIQLNANVLSTSNPSTFGQRQRNTKHD